METVLYIHDVDAVKMNLLIDVVSSGLVDVRVLD